MPWKAELQWAAPPKPPPWQHLPTARGSLAPRSQPTRPPAGIPHAHSRGRAAKALPTRLQLAWGAERGGGRGVDREGWRVDKRMGGASTGRTGELGVDREGWRGGPCAHSPRWEARSTGAVGARAAAELRVAPRPSVPAARSRADPAGQELPASSRAGPLETKHPTPSHVPSHVKAKFRPL